MPDYASILSRAKSPQDVFSGDLGCVHSGDVKFADWIEIQADEMRDMVAQDAEAVRLVDIYKIRAIVEWERGGFGQVVPTDNTFKVMHFGREVRFSPHPPYVTKGFSSKIYHEVSHSGDVRLSLKVAPRPYEQRINNEAFVLKSLAKHSNPCIPSASTGRTTDGRSFIMMPCYADFMNLLELRHALGGSISLDDCLWIFQEVLGVLVVLQECSMVHSSILPQHIMVRLEDRAVRVIDWSSAVTCGDVAPCFEDAPVNAGLHAPEVEDCKRTSSRTDLYSMAATILRITGGTSNTLDGMPDYYPPELCTLFQSCFLSQSRRISLLDFWSEFRRIVGKDINQPQPTTNA